MLKGKSSRSWLNKDPPGPTNTDHLPGNVPGVHELKTRALMKGSKRGSSQLEKLQPMGGGNKRCSRCDKRWSLDSGGWGKRGSIKRGKRKWYNILRAMVKSEKQAKPKQRAHAVLLWDKGLILGKRARKRAAENPNSKMKTKDLAGSATRRRRALLPLDEYRSVARQIERNDAPAKNVGGDLVFVVPLSSAGWNPDHHWGRRKEYFSEKIGQIRVSIGDDFRTTSQAW